MSRLRHEKGLPRLAGAGSGIHRLEVDKPRPFKHDEELKHGGRAHRKDGGRCCPEKVDHGEGPSKLGRKRGGACHSKGGKVGHHGTDAVPDRGMKYGTPLQGTRMDEPDKGEQRHQFKHGGEAHKWIQHAINPKHKGIEQRAAKRAGVSTHEYLEEHKHDSGKAGARARLGLRLSAMSKHRG